MILDWGNNIRWPYYSLNTDINKILLMGRNPSETSNVLFCDNLWLFMFSTVCWIPQEHSAYRMLLFKMTPRYGEKMIHTVREEKDRMSLFDMSLPVISNSYFAIFYIFCNVCERCILLFINRVVKTTYFTNRLNIQPMWRMLLQQTED